MATIECNYSDHVRLSCFNNILHIFCFLPIQVEDDTYNPEHGETQPINDEPDALHPERHHKKTLHPAGGRHRKTDKGGHHEGPRQHAGAAALKDEIMKIKESDLPEEEKQSRLEALRKHVKNGQMMQTMPPEIRERHNEFQQTIRQIQEDETLSEEERNQRIADEKARFKADMEALKASITPDQISRMREERRKTIEGHTAAAVAAKQGGNQKLAREYYRRAKMAAKGQPVPPQQRKRRTPAMKKRSLSEPDFF